MELTVGSIVEGKVTGITKFGAFVTMPGGSGLVHISEIANAYVNDVNDYLTLGQTVKVKVLSITPEGKVNLSVKQALPREENSAPPRRSAPAPRPKQENSAPARSRQRDSAPREGTVNGPSGDAAFEDKLKHYMQEADSRMSGNKLYADRKNTGRRRK